MGSLFDPTSYYILRSHLYSQDYTVNDGYSPGTPAPLYLGNTSYSSQNWQVFAQQGVFFLRNYDYGAAYQLGLSAASNTQPELLPVTGDLSQQWNITVWPDGTMKLVNMAVGPFQMLGVSNDSAGNILPVMNTAELGSHWIFDINTSAGQATAQMVQSLSSIAAPTATAQATASSHSTTQTTISAFESGTSTALPNSASSSSKPSGNSLSGGVMAGIVVGALALIAVLVVGWLVLRRRRRKPSAMASKPMSDPSYTDEPSSAMSAPAHRSNEKSVQSTGVAEVPSSKPPVEMSGEQHRTHNRHAVEML